MKKLIKIVLINSIILSIIFVIFSIIIHNTLIYLSKSNLNYNDKNSSNYNSNTIRATYPNYKNYSIKDALEIFNGYSNPETTYYPFIGWKRNNFKSSLVNVVGEYRTRLSSGHNLDNSIYFFGASTMWGVGADDNNTIPSIFNQLSGENVINMGESGFTTFQEITYLNFMLSNNHFPKMVIFYDGVGDSLFCNKNVKFLPNHSRYEEYERKIKEYDVLEEELRFVTKYNNVNVKIILNKLIRPYKRLIQKIFNPDSVGRIVEENLLNNKKFSEFKKINNYKNCGNDGYAYTAASTTVNNWLIAFNTLKSYNIKSFFFLQPTASINSDNLVLDYLLNTEKQRIVDEKDSYLNQYKFIKKVFFEKCKLYNACDYFEDLSDSFSNIEEEIYIDSVHVSPLGNRIIAEKILNKIKNLE